MPFPRPRHFLSLLIIALFGLTLPLVADDVQLKPDRPERYTVVKGDTLWDIAGRFLQSPWHWPRVWKINESIKNPHLIYPGDVIVLRYIDGQPELTVLRSEKLLPGAADGTSETRSSNGTVKMLPRAYSEPLEQAIPTIPPDAIVPFLTQPRVVGENELEQAGYVAAGFDNRIALGTQSQFYARGLRATDTDAEYFQIFRPGEALRDPESGELLAYEALYLGDARRLDAGNPAKLVVTSVKQEIYPTDRLMVAPDSAALPYYFPRSPGKPINGYVIAALNSVAEIGSYAVVTLSVGEREGLEEGHVLRVLYRQGERRDPLTREPYRLPDEESALALVFRTFEKVSYALVLNATRPVNLLDAVVTP